MAHLRHGHLGQEGLHVLAHIRVGVLQVRGPAVLQQERFAHAGEVTGAQIPCDVITDRRGGREQCGRSPDSRPTSLIVSAADVCWTAKADNVCSITLSVTQALALLGAAMAVVTTCRLTEDVADADFEA